MILPITTTWCRLFPLLLLFLLTLVHSESSSSNTNYLDEPFGESYSKLPHAPCTSLFYRDGRLGCGTADRSLDIGQLVYYNNNDNDNTINVNYIVVLEEFDLTADILQGIVNNDNNHLQGILVLNSTTMANDNNSGKYPSPDARSPQGYNSPSANINYGYYSYPWNAYGENLFGMDWHGVAMAYLYDVTVSDSVRNAAMATSSDSVHSFVGEFNYYMGPESMNSLDCLAWKDVDSTWSPKCLPLGGTSVWASAGALSSQSSSNNNDSGKNTIVIGTNMDSTSLFHDSAPGANTAASNILVVLLAAKLLGQVSDEILEGLSNQIVLAIFQGESYGFMGSRSFFRDVGYPGFQCRNNPVRSSTKLGDESDFGCLFPLRHSLQFADLGPILGMLTVDQLGHPLSNGLFYAHADEANYGYTLLNYLKYVSTEDFSVAQSSAAEGENGYPYPPSPLTSLLSLSGGGVGGAVLTGYDVAFTSKAPYHSHMDSASLFQMDLDAIASAATIVARTAIAAAYDDGSYYGNNDYQTPTNYANNLIPALSSSDETLIELSNCLFYDGNCELIKKYSSVEYANERSRTGVDFGTGEALGQPPSYFVGVYNAGTGQPFVKVGSNYYGAYSGGDFGKSHTDAISLLPRQLEASIRGLMNDFLGRGGDSNTLQGCRKATDCSHVDYCSGAYESATCTGSHLCVCNRAHYHLALDEAIRAAEDQAPGYFVQDEYNDQGVSPIYTEPYWSPTVGVRVYRDVGSLPGFFTLVAGAVVGAASLFGAVLLKVGLKKEKLY